MKIKDIFEKHGKDFALIDVSYFDYSVEPEELDDYVPYYEYIEYSGSGNILRNCNVEDKKYENLLNYDVLQYEIVSYEKEKKLIKEGEKALFILAEICTPIFKT